MARNSFRVSGSGNWTLNWVHLSCWLMQVNKQLNWTELPVKSWNWAECRNCIQLNRIELAIQFNPVQLDTNPAFGFDRFARSRWVYENVPVLSSSSLSFTNRVMLYEDWWYRTISLRCKGFNLWFAWWNYEKTVLNFGREAHTEFNYSRICALLVIAEKKDHIMQLCSRICMFPEYPFLVFMGFVSFSNASSSHSEQFVDHAEVSHFVSSHRCSLRIVRRR